MTPIEVDENDIAIVGMALRVPGATTPEEYWQNLVDGRESLQQYGKEELHARGVSNTLLNNPNYVKAGMPLEGVADFDPEFFGFSPKEAGILDPQHRQFYEVAWEALERSGHPPSKFDGEIGVFAGSGMAAYFAMNVMSNPELVDSVGMFLLRHTGNDKDFLSSRVSYAFDLRGPSVNVQTACSTSLVAVHLAAQSILTGECDMALAGGVTVELPHRVGYMYQEGEILSPDGHCRAFDHQSKGTVFGSGVGVVVVRRLDEALADGDHIHAVIKGSSVNNDGAGKVGYLAPSVEGQSAAIAEALAVADVDADSIGYIECHGTGTQVGDPIEIQAITSAFRETTDKKSFCHIGSVKSNIGHLDTAAGVAGLIKAALAVEHGQIPPSINFDAPNPNIDFDNSPFKVAADLIDWSNQEAPRRAAINSLGVGGTNAFVIIEQAPALLRGDRSVTEPAPQLMTLSARSKQAVDDAAERLADWLQANPNTSLNDISFTLLEGRHLFPYQRAFAAANSIEAVELLRSKNPHRVFDLNEELDQASVVFMYPGGGAQYFQMGQSLYAKEAVFRQEIDRGLETLSSKHGVDLKPVFLADNGTEASTNLELDKPSVQLPLTFLVSYAVTKLLEHYGIRPDALIGHSMGENTAACVAGVFSFEDALGLVLLRGQLMDEVPEGGMLSVPMPAAELKELLGDELDLSSINSPLLSVASGPNDSLERLAETLAEQKIESQKVRINIAAHSRMLDGILDRFRDYLNVIQLAEPKLPVISNRTGSWLGERAATAEYWVEHLRKSVLFSDGVNTLLETDDRVFVEVGPANALSSLVRQNPKAKAQRVVATLRHPEDETDDHIFFRTSLSRLCALGIQANSEQLYGPSPQRVPMTTYPFQHAPYWIEPGDAGTQQNSDLPLPIRLDDTHQWLRCPSWVEQGIVEAEELPHTWLFFAGEEPETDLLIKEIRQCGDQVVVVREGDVYARLDEHNYTLAPETGGDCYDQLIENLIASELIPDRIVHSWLLTRDRSFRPGSSFFHRIQNSGFYSLFYLARAIVRLLHDADERLQLLVLGNGAQQVNTEEVPFPEKATALGPCLVLPRELPNIDCRYIDVVLRSETTKGLLSSTSKPVVDAALVAELALELCAPTSSGVFALRNSVRWQRCLKRGENTIGKTETSRLKKHGTYLITGGMGGIGGALAEHLARDYQANLILLGRTPLPERGEWDGWLAENPSKDSINQAILLIRQLERLGAAVMPIAADVAVAETMQEAVDTAITEFKKIDGVFHAAGLIRDSLLQMKSPNEIEEVFTAKVYGTQVLGDLFADYPLDFMVLFSSSSAFIAPQGQIDYVAANSFVNAFATAAQTSYPVTAVNWGVWKDVGIAAQQPRLFKPEDERKIASQVQVSYPLFQSHTVSRSGTKEVHTFSGELNTANNWVVDDHRLADDTALLPGTGYLDFIRAGMQELQCDDHWLVSSLTFQLPLVVEDETPREFKMVWSGSGLHWRVVFQAMTIQGRWQECAVASLMPNERKAPDPDLAAIAERCSNSITTAAGSGALRTCQEDHLKFGGRWRVLKRLSTGDNEMFAELELPARYEKDLKHYGLHPGILDIATGCAMDLIPGYAGQELAQHLWVPLSYRGFHFYRPLEPRIRSWIRLKDSGTDGFATFRITVTDADGDVLVDIDELNLNRLDGSLSLNSVDQVPTANSTSKLLTPGEIALQHNIEQGIECAQGLDLLEKVIAGSMPAEVVVSSLNINSLIRQADFLSQAGRETKQAHFERPQLESDFIAPGNKVEKELTDIWEDLLGVDGIGIKDSFFDLGGHSLIAVRLFNEIADRFSVDLPMSVLVQSATIESLATHIPASKEDREAPEGLQSKDQFVHVVPMQTGPVGNETPIFMVSGMFGNVLNLNHLAHLIGQERPFYALQARGLYGDMQPHESFEAAAGDYLSEIRRVQPLGPYILGGFSGGGFIAYEIARQLIEAGEHVHKVIMLDTPIHDGPKFSMLDRASILWQRLTSRGLQGFWTNLKDKIRERIEWEKRIRETISDPVGDGDTLHFQSRIIGDSFKRSLARYEIPRVPVDLALYRPKLDVRYRLSGGRIVNRERNYLRPDNGWTPYVRDLQVYEVPGNHDDMVLEPNVRVLAAAIRKVVPVSNGIS